MNLRLSILFLSAPLLYAQEPGTVIKKSPIALLPNGSVLHGVLLPRYDAQRRLVGDLKAETMTLIDGDRIQGEDVLIRFYNPDRTPSGRVELTRALFDQEKSSLTAKQEVKLTRAPLTATGGGLVYSFDSGKGFLLGPVSTRLSPPPTATSMNTNPLTFPVVALLAFAPAILPAAPPAFVSPEELAEIKADAKTAKPKVDAANQSTSSELTTDRKAGNKATEAANAFMHKNDINTIAVDGVNEDPKPLDIVPGKNDTVIDCDGGMYFDADEGVLVYLENVRVTDPRFNLSGANELKIFFDKKPAAKKAAKKGAQKGDPKKAVGPTANFGDVKKLLATGAVKILQKSVVGKAPVEASGAILTYSVQSGEIIISGGFPWVKQGNFFARAKEPNLTLRLLNNGSFSTQGNWQMGGNLNLNGQ
ncbi:MAG: hypothetical protein IZT59_01185 [Verrucomicrobia bacterium]|nr:hypothetical protein [Verrucomicrobiota bacterium]